MCAPIHSKNPLRDPESLQGLQVLGENKPLKKKNPLSWGLRFLRNLQHAQLISQIIVTCCNNSPGLNCVFSGQEGCHSTLQWWQLANSIKEISRFGFAMVTWTGLVCSVDGCSLATLHPSPIWKLCFLVGFKVSRQLLSPKIAEFTYIPIYLISSS